MKNVIYSLVAISLFLSGCSSKKLEKDESCFLVPKTGECRAYFLRYYFDGKECKSFGWGGCGGVVPFKTEQECIDACKKEDR